jgi:ABC-2 type transport system permease protein
MSPRHRRLLRIELAQVIRALAIVACLALTAAGSLAAIHHGRAVIHRQHESIAASTTLQQEQHHSVLAVAPPQSPAGDQLYYLFFHTVHEPSVWAPISLGQRELQPFNLKIRLLALHGQLYDGEIVNPLLAAFGGFDLAFVLVFIAPLLMIALTHNVWSAEREAGTWALIAAQPVGLPFVLAVKVAVRAGVGLAPFLAALGAAVPILGLPLDARLLTVAVLIVLYAILWVGLSLGITALGRSSDLNLLALLGVWILWCLLGPASVSVMAARWQPLPEPLEIAVRTRQGYHDAWHRPVRETMSRFHEHYPEWAGSFVPEDRYSNAWYYAMQQRGDDEAAPVALSYQEALARRRRFTRRAILLFPPALFQAALDDLANTGLDSHSAYLRSVARYHETLKVHFLPAIFDNRPIAAVD